MYYRFILSFTELFPLTAGHNVNLNKLQAVLIVLLKKKYFSSIFSIFFISFHNFLPYFPYHFTIQLVFLPYFSKFSSYQKQALTVMISPLCTNDHDITVILLNVALNTNNLTLYLQRHIPTYLSIYIFIRIVDFIQFLLVIFLS